MATSETRVIWKWECVACGGKARQEAESASLPPSPPAQFSRSGGIAMAHNQIADGQVTGEWRQQGDLCDTCIPKIKQFFADLRVPAT